MATSVTAARGLGTRNPNRLRSDHGTLPKLRCRRVKGRRPQAYVWWQGRRLFMGRWRSAAATRNYETFVWKLATRTAEVEAVERLSVESLCNRYLAHAEEHYQKRGKPTSRVIVLQSALSLLYRSGFAGDCALEVGPLWLKQFQRWMLDHPAQRWSRETINEYVQAIVGMFRWAVSEELARADQVEALKTVPPVRKNSAAGGRRAREGGRVGKEPVDRRVFRLTRRELPRPVRIMVDLQLLTGMRPCEVCGMKPAHVAATSTPGVLAYTVPPEANKLDHHDKPRVIYLGKRAQRLLSLVGPTEPDECYFSPRRTEVAVLNQRRAERQTPMWPSHEPEARRERARRNRSRRLAGGPQYSTAGYAQVIERACARAFGLDGDGRPWVKWSPNQLRHTRASIVANREKLQVAQEILGHTSILTTMRYVKVPAASAIDLARRCG